jgi:hypothetical protein
VATRKFAEAERILDRIKQKIKINERNRGYFQALTGMLLVQKNNDDRYAFLANHNFQDKKELLNYRREFLRQSEFRLHGDYDRGFFSAWADYMRILSKLELLAVPAPNDVQREMEDKEKELKIDETETKKEIKMEAEREEIELIEKAEGAEDVEMGKPRQSNLSDFSK